MSTESIASPAAAIAPAGRCPSCASPLTADQRYCLECGERTVAMSGFLRGQASPEPAAASMPPRPPALAPALERDNGPASPALTIIAGVGVLLLAMGVGVLIGRSGSGGRASTAPAQVITVGAAAGTSSSAAASEASFHSDWPAGTSGYTIRLQTLPESSSGAAVEAAKTAATAKGAPAVGALRAEEFPSVKASGYVVYSGIDTSRAQAVKALASLKKSYPSATVVHVAKGGGGSGATSSGSGGSGAGSSLSHPAPPSVLESLKSTKGKSYVEKSKNLPNVISTG